VDESAAKLADFGLPPDVYQTEQDLREFGGDRRGGFNPMFKKPGKVRARSLWVMLRKGWGAPARGG
jgi:hypothetical protein